MFVSFFHRRVELPGLMRTLSITPSDLDAVRTEQPGMN